MTEQDQDFLVLPLLPTREIVILPHVDYPLSVSRARSVAAIESALQSEDKTLIVVAQRDSEMEEPQQTDLFTVACKALIRKMTRTSSNSVSLTLHGLERVRILDIDTTKLALQTRCQMLPLPDDSSDEIEALHREIMAQAHELESLTSSNWPSGLLTEILKSYDDPLDCVYTLCAALSIELEKQQEILEANSRLQALRLIHGHLTHELQVLSLQRDIAKQAAANVSQEQRQYMLRRQLEEIKKELGEEQPEKAELEELRQQLDAAKLPEAAAKMADRELDRLAKLPAESQEHQLTRSYLELLGELPWHNASPSDFDLKRARQILDEDHFDLEEIKDRIVENLAVYKLNPESRGAILCFVGGPGVGKTSIGASIARALGREFERISLGGLHDEAELRGHRRTYIGAMPGRIIQALRRKGVNNPVLLLDEMDKLGRDYRGDPSAALMEILDPAQNKDFRDNYLDLPFDLSNVFFLATANTLETIPRPLLDRMEVLRLSGYTENEKLQIAIRYLLPRQLKDVKLTPEQFIIGEDALRVVVRRYTREAGVRELERQIARLVRKSALHFAEGDDKPVTIAVDDVVDLLGPERFFPEQMRQELAPGVSVGLAWTEAGGDILFIESVLIPGGQGLMLTGQLGDVMKESAQAARSYLWSQAESLKIPLDKFNEAGVHIHIPAGAIPKDGPSAGVTIACSLLSLLTNKPVRSDTAMTGEITLAGLVLPVGGIKEKVLAAHRAGIRRILLPEQNMKDLKEVDESVLNSIEFIPTKNLRDVFTAAIEQN